jgi:hypothetical protein
VEAVGVQLIARRAEQRTLEEAFTSREPELIAVYGRRRAVAQQVTLDALFAR